MLICYNCKKPGHHWKNCRDPPASAVPHITSVVPVCYHCNETGHKKPECPKLKTGKGDRGTNPAIASSSKGTTMVTRGRAHQMTVEEPVITTTVAYTYLLDSKPDVVMFDSGATHSFVSHTFINRLGRSIGKLAHPTVVDVVDNRTIYVTDVYRGYTLEFSGVEFPIDLIPIAMRKLCVIVGIDWLDAFDVEIHCHKKQVRVRNPRGGELIIQGDIPRLAMASCSSAIALDDVPIVSDFSDNASDERSKISCGLFPTVGVGVEFFPRGTNFPANTVDDKEIESMNKKSDWTIVKRLKRFEGTGWKELISE
ncbi:uncharacterized protein LOC111897404 [Lactuca sativa]|uniref:uncharacterized protein LOC111897404 n=1 Tax=Lactuca sativa TaxID=4236 RepID=UPI0022AEDCCC|nr:uncharacterized protein LOC111897404 [Lactuca sativa]